MLVVEYVKADQEQSPLFEPDPERVWLSDLCLLHRDGELGTVFIAGSPLLRFSYSKREELYLAAALVAEAKAARIGAVLKAFDLSEATLWRARERLRQGGVGAVVLIKHGPKGPTKLKSAVVQRIEQLHEKGLSNSEIGRRIGLSEFSVRQALREDAAPVDEEPKLEFPEVAAASMSSPPDGDVVAAPETLQPEAVADGLEASASSDTEPAVEAPPVAPTASTRETKPTVATRAETPEMAVFYATFGLTRDGEAETVFQSGTGVPFSGFLLMLPALTATGLFETFRDIYGRLRFGIYGLRATVLVLALLALLRRPRPESLKGIDPHGLGDVLGLLRVPEVKTLRRKLSTLAKLGRAHLLIKALGKRWLSAADDTLGTLYIDGHVRVYHGKHTLPKAHVTQRNLCMPATTDYWVNDATGNPVFVLTAQANAGMTKTMPGLLDQLEAELGERRGMLVFDRGGWSQDLFASIRKRGWHLLTYRKGKKQDHPMESFKKVTLSIDGKNVEYMISERMVQLGNGLELREIAVLRADGKQTILLTSDMEAIAALLAYRLFARWRQENYFKYMKENFALDALVDYSIESDNPNREIPNPARKALDRKIAEAKTKLRGLEQELGAAAVDNKESERSTIRGFKIANASIGKRLRTARENVDTLKRERSTLPKTVAIDQVQPANQIIKLSTERKTMTDAIKAAAYRAETVMAQWLRPYFARADEEARAFLRHVVQQPADLCVQGDVLTVRFKPLSAPRFTRALQGLCQELNALNPTFPESSYSLHYEVAEAAD